MGSHSLLSCHSRLLSRISLQLCWSPFRHWKVVKGIPTAFSSPGGQLCSPTLSQGPSRALVLMETQKQDLKLRFLQSHSPHTTCTTPMCSSGATALMVLTGVTTEIYFPSGSYSHRWYFWLKQEETTEILDYKKEKKIGKIFNQFPQWLL